LKISDEDYNLTIFREQTRPSSNRFLDSGNFDFKLIYSHFHQQYLDAAFFAHNFATKKLQSKTVMREKLTEMNKNVGEIDIYSNFHLRAHFANSFSTKNYMTKF